MASFRCPFAARRAFFHLAATALILAGCDSASGPDEPDVTSLRVTPANPVLSFGSTVQLSVTALALDGTSIAGKTVTWSSSNPLVAEVNNAGRVSGTGVGTAEITAAVEGVTGSATVAVNPIVTGFAPAQFVAGQTGQIAGGGFSNSLSENIVTLGHTQLQITSATSTALTVQIPAGLCLPSGQALVRVSVRGHTVESNHAVQSTADPLSIAAGQQRIFPAGQEHCLRFDALGPSEEYLIGITSVSPVAAALTPVQILGAVPRTTTGTTALSAKSRPLLQGPRTDLETDPRRKRWERHRDAELALRSRELQNGVGAALARVNATSSTVPSVPSNAKVGDTVSVNVPNARANSCTNFTPIRAVVRAIGARGVWVEDVANPLGGFNQADFDTASAAFDTRIYPTNVGYFGEPADRDGNNRIVVVTTREVNRMGGILGFVTSADILPSVCPSSNDGEYYYGVAPDSAGEHTLGEYSLAEARANMPVLIAHEFTHIIQFSRRNAAGSEFFSVWEAEGQATFAEEINGHAALGNRPGQNYGFAVAFNVPETAPISWYVGAFVDLALYFGFETATTTVTNAPEQCGWLAQNAQGPCIGNRSIYGVSWSFLRWLADHYGSTLQGGERALHKALIDSGLSGFENISSAVGQPIETLLTRWAAALYLDDRIQNLDNGLNFTSWNMNDIESRLVTNARLTPRSRGFATFSDDVSVRSGSTAYFRVSGTNRPRTTVFIRSPGGGPLPASMRLWVVRVQ